jgi:hypothetical protein
VPDGNSQRGQALPVVLVIMTLILLLAGGVTVGISAVVRQQQPDRASTANDLAAQNTVAAAAASLTTAGAACRSGLGPAASQPLLNPTAPASAVWALSPADSWKTGTGSDGVTTLTFQPPAAPAPSGGRAFPAVPPVITTPSGTALASHGSAWQNYSATAALVPGPLVQGDSVELDVRDQEPANGGTTGGNWYYLALQGPQGVQRGTRWVFGRTSSTQASTYASGLLPTLGPTQQVTLAMEVVSETITAKITGDGPPVVQTHMDKVVVKGTVALRITDSASVEVRRVEVDPRFPLPPPVTVALPAPVPGGSDRYGCQRLDQVAGPVSQRPVGLPPPATQTCAGFREATGPAIQVATGGELKVWLTLAWPSVSLQQAPNSVALASGPCPGPGASADCSLQQVTAQPGLALPESAQQPAVVPVSVVADCLNPTDGTAWYHLFLPTEAKDTLALANLRWAPPGTASVYTTVGWLSGKQRFQESDFVIQGPTTALTYEGSLG